MIYSIESDLPTFKALNFHSGLNILLAEKSEGSGELQTRNRAGKSSMVQIVNFLTGGSARPDSIFRNPSLSAFRFMMTYDVADRPVRVDRMGAEFNRASISGLEDQPGTLFGDAAAIPAQVTVDRLTDLWGDLIFRLPSPDDLQKRRPSFRSLFRYFAREAPAGFNGPKRTYPTQKNWEYQVCLSCLLGLDWRIPSNLQLLVEDEAKCTTEINKSAQSASSLQNEVTRLRRQLSAIESKISSFQVLPQYRQIEDTVASLSRRLKAIVNDNELDLRLVAQLEASIQGETPPPRDWIAQMYADVELHLPDAVCRRLEDVEKFHNSIVRNRVLYLQDELLQAKMRAASRRNEMASIDEKRSEYMRQLSSAGALDDFVLLQTDQAEVKRALDKAVAALSKIEAAHLKRDHIRLQKEEVSLRLKQDHAESKENIEEAIAAFQRATDALLEQGELLIETTDKGPDFTPKIRGNRSGGIRSMEIFAFDMMLMEMTHRQGIGPGFLIHDSHLFDPMEERQIRSSLLYACEMAEQMGFQYIVTLNSDRMPSGLTEELPGRAVLDVRLTDDNEDGGLFGFWF